MPQIDSNHAGSTLRGLFVNNNKFLGALPGAGVGQNLVRLSLACAAQLPALWA